MGEPPAPGPLPRTRRSLLTGSAVSLLGVVAAAAGLAGHDIAPGLPTRSARPTARAGPVAAPVRWRFDGVGRRTALTFDDGPDPRWTPRVLDALAAHDAKATFFMVGERAQRHPELVARVVAAGHEVGNHTWSHLRIDRLDLHQVLGQLSRTHDTLTQLAGRPPTLFRPPWGEIDAVGLLAAAELDYRVVLWSDLVRGTSPEADLRTLFATMQPGAMILGHDGGPTPNARLMAAFRTMVAHLTATGHVLTTVTEALREDLSGL